jgi:hypothetical protein
VWKAVQDDTKAITDREFASRIRLYNALNHLSLDPKEVSSEDEQNVKAASGLRYLVEGQDISMKRWSFSHPSGGYTYNFEHGFGFKDHLQRVLWSELNAIDSQALVGKDATADKCLVLREKSLKALSALSQEFATTARASQSADTH